MKKILISIIIVLLLLLVPILIKISISYLFKAQYNSNGISHFLVITIDKNQEKTYLGTLERHKVYIEGLNIKETNFRTIDAKNISIQEVIEKKLSSIKEWEKYSRRIKKRKNSEILIFENYEMYITSKEIKIRPRS